MLRLRLAIVAALVTLLAACGGAAPRSGVASAPATPDAASEAPASVDAGPSEDPAASEDAEPTDEPTDEPATEEPTDEPTEEPATDEPTEAPSDSAEPTDAPAGAAACSGNDNNRAFYEDLAGQVDWTVLCAVLPKGWFVTEGGFRLKNGGRLIIGYKGPGGATIKLSEGGFCESGDGCVPSGSELGAAALGPLDGTLYQTSDGFAVIAAPGENPSWLFEAKGLAQDAATSLAAALAVVGP